MIYIHHHLGLGDHIVCNALVRHLYEGHGPVRLAVKKRNYESVRALYRDIEVDFHVVANDEPEAGDACKREYKKYKTFRIGFEKRERGFRGSSGWEEDFYKQLGIDYACRYSDFYIQRDYKREQELHHILNPPSLFSFCATTTSLGGHKIKLNTKLPQVRFHPHTHNIFDWIGILEAATEIHTVDTSIFHLIKQLNLKCKKVFYDVGRVVPRSPPTFEDGLWIKKILERDGTLSSPP